MICQKCGREAVVLLGGLCGPCSRGERYQRIGASAAAVLTTTDRCEDANALAALKSRSDGSVDALPADLVARIERQILRFEREHDVRLSFSEAVRTLLDVALTGEEERDED